MVRSIPVNKARHPFVVSIASKIGGESAKVMIVNVNDNSVGGTVSVLAEINAAADGDALEAVIAESTKMDKIGVEGVKKELMETPAVQKLLKILKDPAFRKEIAHFSGNDYRDLGKVMTEV